MGLASGWCGDDKDPWQSNLVERVGVSRSSCPSHLDDPIDLLRFRNASSRELIGFSRPGDDSLGKLASVFRSSGDASFRGLANNLCCSADTTFAELIDILRCSSKLTDVLRSTNDASFGELTDFTRCSGNASLGRFIILQKNRI